MWTANDGPLQERKQLGGSREAGEERKNVRGIPAADSNFKGAQWNVW